ncbi:MAG: methionine--tRNA ligase subunit beta [bacterium]|nr:methionine--tRNA ligase subunit beta [bacterium]
MTVVQKEVISIDDLVKIDLRIGTIKSAERVEGSEKLLKLSVDCGEQERQIVAGIGKRYMSEDLIGMQILLVLNLAPRIMMGLESQGMLLASDDEDGPVLITPATVVRPGATLH